MSVLILTQLRFLAKTSFHNCTRFCQSTQHYGYNESKGYTENAEETQRYTEFLELFLLSVLRASSVLLRVTSWLRLGSKAALSALGSTGLRRLACFLDFFCAKQRFEKPGRSVANGIKEAVDHRNQNEGQESR